MSYQIKGFSFAYGAKRGDLRSEDVWNSLMCLKETGTEWIALCVVQMVEDARAQKIRYDYSRGIADLELIDFIQKVHEQNMKVCLKPMINCEDGTWRAEIDFGEEEDHWDTWFYEYEGYLVHMAEIAERTGCEMLCLGCEMLGMEKKEQHWRRLITKVRACYQGLLTYNTNHGKEMRAGWYDAIDYLGTSAYFPVAKKGGADLAEMTAGWEQVKEKMQKFHERYQKPVLFMEIGCRSAEHAAVMPWDFMHREWKYSEEEQARFYESCLKTFQNVPWFAGFFWWDWGIRLPEAGSGEKGFAIHGKKAEKILKQYYLGSK